MESSCELRYIEEGEFEDMMRNTNNLIVYQASPSIQDNSLLTPLESSQIPTETKIEEEEQKQIQKLFEETQGATDCKNDASSSFFENEYTEDSGC